MEKLFLLLLLLNVWIPPSYEAAVKSEKPITVTCVLQDGKLITSPSETRLLQELCSDLLMPLDVRLGEDHLFVTDTEAFAVVEKLAKGRRNYRLYASLKESQWEPLLTEASEGLLSNFVHDLWMHGFRGVNLGFDSIRDVSVHSASIERLKNHLSDAHLILLATVSASPFTSEILKTLELFEKVVLLPVTHIIDSAEQSEKLMLKAFLSMLEKGEDPERLVIGIPPVIFTTPDSQKAPFSDFVEMCESRELETRTPVMTSDGLVEWNSNVANWTISVQSRNSLINILSILKNFRVDGILLPSIGVSQDNLICANYASFFSRTLISLVKTPSKQRIKRSESDELFTVIKMNPSNPDMSLLYGKSRSALQKPMLVDIGKTVMLVAPGEFANWVPDVKNQTLHIPFVFRKVDVGQTGPLLDEQGRVMINGKVMSSINEYLSKKTGTPRERGKSSSNEDWPNTIVFPEGGKTTIPVPALISWKIQNRQDKCDSSSCTPAVSLFNKPVLPAKSVTTCSADSSSPECQAASEEVSYTCAVDSGTPVPYYPPATPSQYYLPTTPPPTSPPDTYVTTTPAETPPTEYPPDTYVTTTPAETPPTEYPPDTYVTTTPAESPTTEYPPDTYVTTTPAETPTTEYPPDTYVTTTPAETPTTEYPPDTYVTTTPAETPTTEYPPDTYVTTTPAETPTTEYPPDTSATTTPPETPSTTHKPNGCNKHHPPRKHGCHRHGNKHMPHNNHSPGGRGKSRCNCSPKKYAVFKFNNHVKDGSTGGRGNTCNCGRKDSNFSISFKYNGYK